ncbi:hypothetical protein KIPB_012246, partial [Kipferlia bialata]|eukprot:g12246.t1
MYSEYFRYRCIWLNVILLLDRDLIAFLLGCSIRAQSSWYQLWLKTGEVIPETSTMQKRGRKRVLDVNKRRWMRKLFEERPTLYLDEVRDAFKVEYPGTQVPALSTFCKTLSYMGLTRKKVSRYARQSSVKERISFIQKYGWMVTDPSRIIIIDETAKHGVDGNRSRGRSQIGTECIERQDFGSRLRHSILAAFNRMDILPHMNEWPGENSVALMDGARTHMCHELIDIVHLIGGEVAIEFAFGPMKGALKRLQVSDEIWNVHGKTVVEAAM